MGTRTRILSLDVLRGLTVAAMILVNNPAVWGKAYAPLQHAFWHGLTPTDLIYPFFVFIMGVSGYFSLYRRSSEDRNKTIIHVIRRSVLIFLTGVGLNLISALAYGRLTSWETFRIMGVLQGLAIAYLFGSMFMIFTRFRKLVIMAVGLLAVYMVILLSGHGFELAPENIIAVVDRALMGAGHLYVERLPDGSVLPFEPEAILSSIPRIAQFLLGAAVGKFMYEGGKAEEVLNKVMLYGAVLVISGFLLEYGCPLNKKIWSPSFALVTSGFAALSAGLLYWLIDMKGKTRWTGFFRVFGVNPLFLYVLAWVLSVLVNMNWAGSGSWWTVKGWFYGSCIDPFFGDAFGSLIYSLIFVAVVWVFGYLMDRRKIYIKL